MESNGITRRGKIVHWKAENNFICGKGWKDDRYESTRIYKEWVVNIPLFLLTMVNFCRTCQFYSFTFCRGIEDKDLDKRRKLERMFRVKDFCGHVLLFASPCLWAVEMWARHTHDSEKNGKVGDQRLIWKSSVETMFAQYSLIAVRDTIRHDRTKRQKLRVRLQIFQVGGNREVSLRSKN